MDNPEKMEFLERLESSIEKSTWHLNQILEQFGWEKDGLIGAPELRQCQLDGNHFVPESITSRHNKYCELRRQKLTREEAKELLERSGYSQAAGRLVFNADDISQLLPQGYSISAAYSRPQDPNLRLQDVRLAVYDQVVARTRQMKQVESKVDDELFFLDRKGWEKKKEESDNKGKSFVEQLAEQRDQRRRRQTYRAKNVHITRKSHTEIIREVINNQMEVLGRIIQDEEAARTPSAPTADGSREGGSREGSQRDEGSSRDGEERRNRRDDSEGSRRDDRDVSRRDDRESSRHKKHKRKRSRSRSRERTPSSYTESHHKRHKKHRHKKDKEKDRDTPARS